MKLSKLLTLSATLFVSLPALAEPITVYKARVRDMPVIEAEFAADLKAGKAWVNVITTREAEERVYLDSDFKLRSSKYDDFEMETTVKRAKFALTLDKDGSIVLDRDGTAVVCATAKRKKRLLVIPYTKITPTGRCVLNAYTNVEVNEGRQYAIVELEVR